VLGCVFTQGDHVYPSLVEILMNNGCFLECFNIGMIDMLTGGALTNGQNPHRSTSYSMYGM
jgi:hypothetical protein